MLPTKSSILRTSTRNLFLAFVSAAVFLLTLGQANAIIDSTLQMQLGNPSGAIVDTNNHNHYLLQRPVEAIDYSDNLGEPVWVSWDLTTADIGTVQRLDNYTPDPNLPLNFYHVTDGDYSGVGGINFNRGHMCPSEDRTDTRADNDMLFLMSNIIPQAAVNNQGVWGTFEGECRNLANAGNEILIICGPSGFASNTRIPSGKAVIADYTWKIVVVVPLGAGTAASRITTSTRVIALKIPNTNNATNTWQSYVTSASQIEVDTGFTFFTALAPAIASALRSKVDGQAGSPPGITGFSPASGAANASVVLTGTNFTSATSVTFNGVSATFNVDSATQITATVPANATTGLISVTTPNGTALSSSNFTVTGASVVDLAITKTHVGNFTQGDTGDTYTITVTNIGGAASSGTVTVTDTLPVGLTATAISGTGWTADLNTLTCTRSDVLAASGVYPSITVTVNVAANAATSITNSASVSGGGDANSANNTANNATTINTAGGGGGGGGSATNVVISQIYGGGGNAGATYQNDFVELYNPLPTAVNLSTWSVQYASATGSSWSGTKINLTGSIQPNRYYLIKMASNGAVGAALPTADVTSTINMSASNGKVALVSNQTALTTTNPISLGQGVVDFVGYGSTANAAEGGSVAPSPSVTSSIVRLNGGDTDSNTNSADFVVASPFTPRNSSSPPNVTSSAPVITAQPQSTNTVVGSNVTFTVTATGTPAVSYQWQLANTNLPTATNATLTLTNVTFGQAGTYNVVVTNSVGPVTSSNAVLTVYATAAANLSSAGYATNQFHFSIAGVPGYNYSIQASTNLIDWVQLQTITPPFNFFDTNATIYPMRFYRVLNLP